MPRQLSVQICLLSLVLLFAGSSALSKQHKTESDSATSQILRGMEQSWLNAEKNHDVAAFEKLVADDWIAITPDGKTQTKTERAAEIKDANTTSATMGDMKVRVFDNTAVVTGADDESTTEDGKKSTAHYVWTDVFVKRDGRWEAVASQTAQIR
jgi:ketosteroid isomerase-like protein